MDKILRAALAAIETVNGQVYPVIADETASGAYLVYRQTKNTPLTTLDGDTGCSTVIYEISSIADKYGICQEVMAAATAACRALPGTEADNTYIQTVDVIDQSPQSWSQEMGSYVATLTISCFIYQE